MVAYARHCARIILVDASDRVLLLRALNDAAVPDGAYSWLTPGGGIEPGESLAEAAARELDEEIGLAVTPAELGQPVAHTGGHADLGWARGMFREEYFFHRVSYHEVDVSAMQALESRHHAGYRWWSRDDLAATTDSIVPWGLAGLLSDLLIGRIPSPPVALPWHH